MTSLRLVNNVTLAPRAFERCEVDMEVCSWGITNECKRKEASIYQRTYISSYALVSIVL